MVGDGRVGDVRAPQPRHVASDATIVLVASPALALPNAAAVLSMTLQATPALIGDPLLGRSHLVGIVTGNTAEPPFAHLVATANLHLLYLTHGFVVLGHVLGLHEYRPERLQRQAGAEIVQAVPVPDQPFFA